MKKLFVGSLVSFIVLFLGQSLVAQDHHHYSHAEFKRVISQKSKSDLVDMLSKSLSFYKISDDIRLNLYRQDHQPSVDFILNRKSEFIHSIASQLKKGTIATLADYKELYNNWIHQLSIEINDIPLTHKGTQDSIVMNTREYNGPCVNMDFEDGTFNGWELFSGKQPGNAPYAVNNVNPATPGTQHFIMNGGNDPVVGIPRVNPAGGQFSAQLGNGNSSNADVGILRQSYLVDANNGLFTYSYAIVVEDPGHTLNEQPYFVVRMYDQAGNDIPCGSYSVQSTASNPDFISAPNDILYQNWKTAFAPLTAYVGQNVTIEFRVADCSQAGHYGYAYVDASCSPFEIITSTGDPFICAGEPLELTAPAGATSYLWNTGATTQTITVTSGGYYEVQMVPITGAGCAITAGIQVGEAPNPVADFTVFPNQVCLGESLTFTDNSTVSSGFVEFWQWDFGNGISTQSANGVISSETNTSGTYDNPTHLFESLGGSQVTLTITSDAGCTDQITKPIDILAPPVISAGPDQFLCPGDGFIPSGQGGVSYEWSNDLINGQEISVGNSTITYTVIGYDANGCWATDSITIHIDEPIMPDAGPDQQICFGNQVILTASGTPSFSWTNGVQNGVAFSPNQTETYTVSYTSPNGCVSSDEVVVTVLPLPIIEAGNDVDVCAGQTVVLSGSGGVSYVWDNGVTNGVAFTPQEGTVIYTVEGTDNNGCIGIDQVQVTVHEQPSPNFNVMNNLGCAPVSPTFSSNVANASYSCEWNFGNGDTSNQCSGSVTTQYTEAGCFDVSLTVTSQYGCSTTVSQQDAVCVFENPEAIFEASPQQLTSINPVSDMLNYSYNAVNYEWNFGDGSTSDQVSPTHVFSETGTLTVMLIAISEDGCRDTTYRPVHIVEELVVYVPNTFTPDNDDFNETFLPILNSGFDPYSYHLIIFNRWGEVLFESYDASVGWDGTYGGKLVQDGTYIWQITVKRNGVDDREVFKGHVNIIR